VLPGLAIAGTVVEWVRHLEHGKWRPSSGKGVGREKGSASLTPLPKPDPSSHEGFGRELCIAGLRGWFKTTGFQGPCPGVPPASRKGSPAVPFTLCSVFFAYFSGLLLVACCLWPGLLSSALCVSASLRWVFGPVSRLLPFSAFLRFCVSVLGVAPPFLIPSVSSEPVLSLAKDLCGRCSVACSAILRWVFQK